MLWVRTLTEPVEPEGHYTPTAEAAKINNEAESFRLKKSFRTLTVTYYLTLHFLFCNLKQLVFLFDNNNHNFSVEINPSHAVFIFFKDLFLVKVCNKF